MESNRQAVTRVLPSDHTAADVILIVVTGTMYQQNSVTHCVTNTGAFFRSKQLATSFY